MFSGLVVRTGSMDFTVVLSDVKIDRPRTELVGHLLVCGPEFLIGIAVLQERVIGGIVAHEV